MKLAKMRATEECHFNYFMIKLVNRFGCCVFIIEDMGGHKIFEIKDDDMRADLLKLLHMLKYKIDADNFLFQLDKLSYVIDDCKGYGKNETLEVYSISEWAYSALSNFQAKHYTENA